MKIVVMLLVVTAVVLAGCSSEPAFIPGSAGGYTAPQLRTERGQLVIGRMACKTADPTFTVDDMAASLAKGGVPLEEGRRFVTEARAQCGYLLSPSVDQRLAELGGPR